MLEPSLWTSGVLNEVLVFGTWRRPISLSTFCVIGIEAGNAKRQQFRRKGNFWVQERSLGSAKMSKFVKITDTGSIWGPITTKGITTTSNYCISLESTFVLLLYGVVR